MLDKDPNQRPTAVEILQDPFVKGHMEVGSAILGLQRHSYSIENT